MDEEKRYSALTVSQRSTKSVTSSSPMLTLESAAMEAAKVLMGSFPDHGKTDPNVFVRQLRDLFMLYPEVSVRAVAKQLPSTLKWLPTLFEVKEALEDNLDPGRKFRMANTKSTPDTFDHSKDQEPDSSLESRERVRKLAEYFSWEARRAAWRASDPNWW